MRNWAEIGLDWAAEEVMKQFGENNQSDKRIVGVAQLPIVTDIDKLGASGVDVLAWLNSSNSLRVRAQALGRSSKLPKNAADEKVEQLREKVYSAMLGVRMSGGRVVERIVTVVEKRLPDGTIYKGESEEEFRAAFAAALIDLGVESAKALEMAKLVEF